MSPDNKENTLPHKRPLPASSWDTSIDEVARKKQTTFDNAFDRGFEALLAFQKKHGHVNIPYRYDGKRKLGTFVARIRKMKDELAPRQLEKLSEIGFSFQSSQERGWNSKFERLKKYYQKYGNTMVPTVYNEDTELGEWVAKQRQKFKQGRLSTERKEKLDSLKFVYRINKFAQRNSTPREDKKWYGQMEKLFMFSLEWGHTLVPFQYKGDKSLGRWVNEQRCQNMRGLLRQDRKNMLHNIGFIWKVTGRDDNSKTKSNSPIFDAMFRKLVEYKAVNGSFNKIGNDPKLGDWAAEQRLRMEQGQIDEIRALKFSGIGFLSGCDSKTFRRNIQKMALFQEKNAYKDHVVSLVDSTFTSFCVIQQYLFKTGNLTIDRKQKLTEVGFQFDATPISFPVPESRYVSRESSLSSIKNSKPTKTKAKVTFHVTRQIDEFDDSTMSSIDGCDTVDTAIDASRDTTGSQKKGAVFNDREGYIGLFAIALN